MLTILQKKIIYIYILTSFTTGSITILDNVYKKLYSLEPPEDTNFNKFINKYVDKNMNYDEIIIDSLKNINENEKQNYRVYGFNCAILDKYILVFNNSPVVYLAKLPTYTKSNELYTFITPEWNKIVLPLTDDEIKDYTKFNLCIVEMHSKFMIIYVNNTDNTHIY